MREIIKTICSTCSCNANEAHEHLSHEIENLRELRELESEGLAEVNYQDFENACSNLGLEPDYIEYFINALT